MAIVVARSHRQDEGKSMPPSPRVLNIIDGVGVSAESGAEFDRRSPVDGGLVATVARSGAADVDRAVRAARSAWRAWAAVGPVGRGAVLRDVARGLDAQREPLLAAVRAETGKPERDLAGEFGAAQELVHFMASEGRRSYGRTIPSAMPGKHVATERAPVGVAGLITAANTPLPNYAWKVVPALLCGNTVVLKPSEHTPCSSALFVETLLEAGVPTGVIQLVHGLGPEAGRALVDHRGVDLVSFTGGVDAGRDIATRTGARLAKTCLELGGNNPFVVCEDADLDRAAEHAVASAFSNAGQRCAAAGRIIVVDAVREEFLSKFLQRAERLVVGVGAAADIGPVISPVQLEAILASIESACAAGARVLLGGSAATDPPLDGGCFMRPTLLEIPTGELHPMSHEVFGPVATFETVPHFAAALEAADDTDLGLTAAIHTRDMSRARQFVDHVQAGMVAINGPTHGSEPHTPFGGFRSSGNGHRECGTEVLDFYSEWKAINSWTV